MNRLLVLASAVLACARPAAHNARPPPPPPPPPPPSLGGQDTILIAGHALYVPRGTYSAWPAMRIVSCPPSDGGGGGGGGGGGRALCAAGLAQASTAEASTRSRFIAVFSLASLPRPKRNVRV